MANNSNNYERQVDVDSAFQVDETQMLQRRKVMMRIAVVQVACVVVMSGFARRAPALLVMDPFFIGAAVMGYYGARDCKPLLVFGHACGSAGLSLMFMLFMLAEQFFKVSEGHDWLIFAINFPMDAFLFCTSYFSIRLWASMRELNQQLRGHQQNTNIEEALLRAGVRQQAQVDYQRRLAELRNEGRGPSNGISVTINMGNAQTSAMLENDLLCPITREVMKDPVIMADGHSYEREAIMHWLQSNSISPMTGRILPHKNPTPNIRLRNLIQDIVNSPQM